MRNLKLFVLGQKGYATVAACLNPEFIEMIQMVVIGEDKNLEYDYSDDIRVLCETAGIRHSMRQDYSPEADGENYIAIASGWRWMIRQQFHPLIVIHDSLLPKYRGFNPLVTALLNYDNVIGATAFIANQEFDKGRIIGANSSTISYPIKVKDAMELMAKIISKLTLIVLSKIKHNDSLEGLLQDESRASYSVWRDSDDYWIDWSKSANNISHFVNCVSYPYAGASTMLDDQLIRILEATAVQDVNISNRRVGKVLFVEDDKPFVICGEGLLRIDHAVDEQGNKRLPLPRLRVRFKTPAI